MALPHALTARQARFVEEYLIDLNATQAAIRAGYSARRASEIGHQLLQTTQVAEAVAAAQAERSERTQITADQVARELAAIAFSRMTRYARWGHGADLELTPSDELTELEASAVLQVFSTCRQLIKNLPALVRDPHRVEDVDTDGPDDEYDALRYGAMATHWFQRPRVPRVRKLKVG